MSDVPTVEGKAEYKVDSEIHYTWYKVVGDLKAGRPLVALHGGPGCAHHYLLSLVDLTTKHNIPVVFYDQIGIGSSTHLPHKPKEFWTPALFIDELENLLTHLGIAGDFDLLGHSWGGMLGAYFAATRQPVGLRHLVISDSPASMPLWEEAAERLLQGIPQDVQDVLRKHEDAGTTDSPEFQAAMRVFNAKHVCRINPTPELSATFHSIGQDPTVYHTMNGFSEFHVTGTLKGWSTIDELHKVQATTLVLNGRYDNADDHCVLPFFRRIPKAKWVQFAESGHMPQWEERERYVEVVADFLSWT